MSLTSLASTSDPTPCLDFIREQLAMAQQTNQPLEPSPTLFNSAQCGPGGRLPDRLSPSSCPDQGYANLFDNCLRVINQDQFTMTARLNPNQFNILDKAAGGATRTVGLAGFIYSWAVPPNYRIYFTANNPADVVLQNNKMLTFGPGEVVVNAFASKLAHADGTTFIRYVGSTGDTPESHQFPYLVIVRLEPMANLLYNMCTDNVAYIWGSIPLNTVWTPQSPGCDRFMNFLCAADPGNPRCICYLEQERLNKQYGTALNVPVCCFGSQCAKTELAYKTAKMLQQCCSFAVCQTIVNQTPALQQGNGTVECAGSFVQYPVEPKDPSSANLESSVTPSVSVAIELIIDTVYPFWVWICLGISAFLFVILLIILSIL